MNQDGTFETRKEIMQAMFSGETVQHSTLHSYWYDKKHDRYVMRRTNGDIDSRIDPPHIAFPNDWRILKPKKRRLIKDHVKQATQLLKSGYVPDAECWYSPNVEIAFYHTLWTYSGDEVYDTNDGYYNTKEDGSGYEIREEWTEEYEDDE